MMRRGRTTGWLALLTVLFYGLAPVAAALSPVARAGSGQTGSATHVCACRVDPHATAACCCAGADTGSCGLQSSPCGSAAPAADPGRWRAMNLPHLPARRLAPARVPAHTVFLPPAPAHLRSLAFDPLTPPPQAPA